MAIKKKGSTKAASTTATASATATRSKPSLDPSPNMASDSATDVSLGYSVLQLEAMLANFNLDAHSTLLALRRSQQLRLLQIQRHWATALSSLDPQIQQLSLGRFLGEFEGDRDKALRGVVGGMLRERQPPMGQVEQSARKRKRTDLNKSPARALDDDDPFTGPNASSKKLRHAVSESAMKKKAKAQATAAAKGRGSPSTARKPRLRLRPSTSAASTSTTNDSNFIYRSGAPSTSQASTSNSTSFHPALPPTPSHHNNGGGTARRPRRGESIVLQSVNGSPLGEFVASDVEDDLGDEEEEEEEQEGEEEWDLMERNEASRVEEQPALKGKGGKGGKAARSKLSKPPPSSTSFNPSLPSADGAPSYDALKQQVIAGMRADLEKREMSKEERRRLLESLERFEMGGM